MENFRRSLKYLWPYRRRLVLAFLCILIIAALWAGGLGMFGPATRILLNERGLHGWAYSRLANDRLDAKLTIVTIPDVQQQENPADDQDEENPADDSEQQHENPIILSVSSVGKEGPAAKAGIAKGEWITGIYSDQQELIATRGDSLMADLAACEDYQTVTLRITNPLTDDTRQTTITLGKAKWSSRNLGKIVSYIPTPTGPNKQMDRYRILLWMFAIVVVITLLRNIFRFIQEYLVETAVYRGIIDLRCDTYNAALRLPLTYYSEKGTTDTMSRFIQDINGLARAQVTLFGKTLAEPAKALATLGMALFLSWELTLLALLAGPPVFFLIRKFGKRMKRASKKALEGGAVLLKVLEETLTGIRVVKVYTMEGTERKRFLRANRNLYEQQKKMAKIDAATGPTVEALGITAAMGAAALGGYWIFSDQMDAEDFIAVMACLAAMFDPLRKLSKVVTRFQRAEAAATRVFEIQDREQEKSLPGAPMLPRHCKSIELRDVRFRYPSASEDALREINLTIDAGQTIAIVGPNGCGKTTLVSLLPRLLDPTEGTMLLDGCDVSKYSIRSLRRQIAVVTQETVIFNATIGENIAYGLRRPKEQAVLSAAKRAFVDEFVCNLPEKYNTMVGEHGATLSGGQRQRISIARAILRDPAILIFDEATSQIDADSERRIHQAMEEFVKDRTTLMIAHRFATVLHADRIMVMDGGRVIDSGTHAELLEQCQLYAHLYQTQLADTSD